MAQFSFFFLHTQRAFQSMETLNPASKSITNAKATVPPALFYTLLYRHQRWNMWLGLWSAVTASKWNSSQYFWHISPSYPSKNVCITLRLLVYLYHKSRYFLFYSYQYFYLTLSEPLEPYTYLRNLRLPSSAFICIFKPLKSQFVKFIQVKTASRIHNPRKHLKAVEIQMKK